MADHEQDIIVDLDEAQQLQPAADVPVLDEDGALSDLPKGAEPQPDGSVIYALRHPRVLKFRRSSEGTVREEPIDTLHFHRLTGADMRAVAAVKSEQMSVVAIAKSTRINEAKMGLIFDRLDGEDAAAAGEIVGSFLGPGRKTGR